VVATSGILKTEAKHKTRNTKHNIRVRLP